MLGAAAASACCVPGAASPAALHPLERAGLEHAVPRRLLQLAAGRAAARAALAELGLAGAVIPRGRDGAPVWPCGWAGSIAHTEALAIAVAARARLFAGLGVDLEPDAPLDAELVASIATPAELHRLHALAPANAGEHARALFCAKEAAYKCQYPMTGLLLDFGDLEIQPVESEPPLTRDKEFTAIFQRDVPPFRCGDGLRGHVGRAEGHVVAVCASPRSAP